MELTERIKRELAEGQPITDIVHHLVMQAFEPDDIKAGLQENGFAVVMVPNGIYFSQEQFEPAEREKRETWPLSAFENYQALPK